MDKVELWEDQPKLPILCGRYEIRAVMLSDIPQETPFNEKGQGHERVTYVGLETFNSHGTLWPQLPGTFTGAT